MDTTEDDLKVLRAFSRRSQELQSAVKNLPQEFTISYDAEDENQNYITGAIDGVTESGLVTIMRQLIIADPDNISFPRVCNILKGIYRDDPEKKKRIQDYKKAWEQSVVGHSYPLGFSFGGAMLTNRDVINLLAYTGKIHTDITKTTYDQLEMLEKSGSLPLIHLLLSGMVEIAAYFCASLEKEFVEPALDN